MNKLTTVLSQGKSIIPFVTCGDPDLQTTAAVVHEMAAAGADAIALGIPFSDPTAEGPVVQGANIRALAAGTTTDRIFNFVQELRHEEKVPLIFVTYANVVFSYGAERFVGLCQKVDVAGLILLDLIAPTDEERITMIAKEADGFLYAMAVTNNEDLAFAVNTARQQSEVPCIVGVPDCTPEEAQQLTAVADGILVETGIVKLVESYGKAAAPHAGAAIRALKAAVNA